MAAPSFQTQRLSIKEDSATPLISPQGFREDGRHLHECRPAFMRTGAVNAAAGSAYAELGQTKVLVSVFGPRESKKAQVYSDIGRLNCDVRFSSFAGMVRGRAGQSMEEKEYSNTLLKALEGAVALNTFPKTTVDVFAFVLQSDGGDFSAIVLCASLALADAGIVMHDLVASVSLSCFEKKLVLDPTSKEENSQDGNLTLSCMTSRNEITQLALSGEWPQTRLSEALKMCLDACGKLAELMRETLREAAVDE